MRDEKTIESIKEVLYLEKFEFDNRLNSFFNLLFWKNYSNGYVNSIDKNSIVREIDNNADEERLSTSGILPLVNRIRNQIGLPELTDKLDNIIQEVTPEVRKKLILKGLE